MIHDTFLEPATLDAMARSIKDKKLAKGTVIMDQGKETEAGLYLVRSGRIRIVASDGSRDDTIGEGAFFGEGTLECDRQYASAPKDTDLEVNVDMSSEYVMSKPTRTKARYTITVVEDAVCGVLSLKVCRTLFDTTRFGRGKKGHCRR